MERLTSAAPWPEHLRGGVIALGNFDGFHRGHQAVVAKARARAGAAGRPLIVATFDPHPVRYFHPDAEPFRLTTLDQRARLFRSAGADAMLVFEFNAELASVPAVDFFTDRIVARTGARAVVTGQDYVFGKGRSGDVALLAALGRDHGVEVETVAAVEDGSGPISSSRIRAALREGDCETATLLLTRPFAIEGIVQHGNKIGRTIGFPTANLRLERYLRPRYGVYAVRGRLPGGRVLDGVANLGVRPVIDPPEELLEPYFFDFTGDLYDQAIEVELIRFIRPEAKLSGLDELMQWIARDCEAARAILAATPHLA
ncbi:MAG: bifunctional riboflavin kinase/FAD synthetase [Sphingomonadaceae bacterium]|nr:bifunctional riboflavin kinase/FAD synthetase [Sphingomonadaceae bacterium]